MTLRSTTVTLGATERVTLGTPAAEAISAEAERYDARRVFVLAGGHLATQTDEVRRIEHALGRRFAVTHHGIRAHAPKGDVLAAAARARECGADLVIAVGGGSVTDAGKIVTLVLKNGARTIEELNALRFRHDARGSVEYRGGAPDVRVVCVPVTLSAGEFNTLAGTLDEERNTKEGFGDPMMAPVCVVLDPAITVHTPEWLWLSTGIRAVDHATEALASLLSNDYADTLAVGALRLLSQGLRAVHQRPNDLEARLKCQIGAWQSILPIVSGVPMGASHAIGHAMGGYNVPHGYTSCVMAPYVQRWNAIMVAERQTQISAALGEAGVAADVALDRLIRDLGLPRTLGEIGLAEEHILPIAQNALTDIWGQSNPRAMTSVDDYLEILDMARD